MFPKHRPCWVGYGNRFNSLDLLLLLQYLSQDSMVIVNMFLALVNIVCRAMYGIMGLPRMCPSIYPNHGTFEDSEDMLMSMSMFVLLSHGQQRASAQLYPYFRAGQFHAINGGNY